MKCSIKADSLLRHITRTTDQKPVCPYELILVEPTDFIPLHLVPAFSPGHPHSPSAVASPFGTQATALLVIALENLAAISELTPTILTRAKYSLQWFQHILHPLDGSTSKSDSPFQAAIIKINSFSPERICLARPYFLQLGICMMRNDVRLRLIEMNHYTL